MTDQPLLVVTDLAKHFPVERGFLRRNQGAVRAVDGVSFQVARGETLAIVGESGCGKSTVARLILRLIEPTAGRVTLDGVDLTALSRDELASHRRALQMVFQDPYASLNPRLTIASILSEPLENFTALTAPERDERVGDLLARVGLPRDAAQKYPFEFSGGQRQRIGLARALAAEPSLIIADEPVSALDVSVQAQILNLMRDLQDDTGVAYLFISHDLGVVAHVAQRVAVMYLGRIVEIGPTDALFTASRHPYTRALMAAQPVADPSAPRRQLVLDGDVPSPMNPPSGCTFHSRCPFAMPRCRVEIPELRNAATNTHRVACHLDDMPLTP